MFLIDKLKNNKTLIYSIISKYNADRLYVFGSCARKEETSDSDIDLIFDSDDNYNFTLFDWINMENELSKELNHKVDLIPMSSLLNDTEFSDEVKKQMIIL